MTKKTGARAREFEKSLKELETIVEKMEKGSQSLEISLRDFERGVQLVKECRESLEKAETKVQQLMNEEEFSSKS